jgi:transposase
MYKVSEAEQRFSAVLAECGDSRIAAERLGYSASYGRALLFRLRKKGECPPMVKAKR